MDLSIYLRMAKEISYALITNSEEERKFTTPICLGWFIEGNVVRQIP